jgi:hypothetical protein
MQNVQLCIQMIDNLRHDQQVQITPTRKGASIIVSPSVRKIPFWGEIQYRSYLLLRGHSELSSL